MALSSYLEISAESSGGQKRPNLKYIVIFVGRCADWQAISNLSSIAERKIEMINI
jgi:hypothetical protein